MAHTTNKTRPATGNEAILAFERFQEKLPEIVFNSKRITDYGAAIKILFPSNTDGVLSFSKPFLKEDSNEEVIVDLILNGSSNSNIEENECQYITCHVHINHENGDYVLYIDAIVDRGIRENGIGEIVELADVEQNSNQGILRGNLSLNFYANAASVLDRGRRDFLSTKWVDRVITIAENHYKSLTSDYPYLHYKSLEQAIWSANLFRKNALEPHFIGERGGSFEVPMDSHFWTGDHYLRDIVNDIELMLYLEIDRQDWVDRWYNSFSGTHKPIQLAAARYKYINKIISQNVIFKTNTFNQYDEQLRNVLKRELATLVAALQNANMSGDLEEELNGDAKAKTEAILNDNHRVDENSLQILSLFELEQANAGDTFVIQIIKPLVNDYHIVEVTLNDSEGVDFKNESGDTFTVYFNEAIAGVSIFKKTLKDDEGKSFNQEVHVFKRVA